MKRYGLIGFPLGHSFSKKYFTHKFEQEGIADCTYELFPLADISSLPTLITENPDLAGLNVTIPYKQTVIPYLDEMHATARGAGAVNTIRMEAGKLSGYNTDVFGFEKALLHFLQKSNRSMDGLNALVLGTGGAAKAVVFVCKNLGIPVQLVSRNAGTGQLVYQDLNKQTMLHHSLIINTTPLGMSPNVDTCPPLPYQHVHAGHLFFDLVYNPGKTLFLTRAEAQGAKTCNGLEMLYLQAEKSWEIWNEE